jgi:hypothetical protein
VRLFITIIFFAVILTSQASAQTFNWSVEANGTLIDVQKAGLPVFNHSDVSANKLVFGADLPAAQQMEVGAMSVSTMPDVLRFTIPAGAPSGPMNFVGTATVPSNGKLLIIEDQASCSAVNFTPQKTGTYDSCYFPANFTQGSSDYLIIGSTVSGQDYFSVNTSNFTKSTGNVVTLNNVVLRRDPVTQKFGALKVLYTTSTGGQKDTLNLTSAFIGGWLWGKGEVNVNGTVKTVGSGSITLATGTMNINAPSGVLWLSSNNTVQIGSYGLQMQDDAKLNSNNNIYQDISSGGINILSGTLLNNGMLRLSGPNGLVTQGPGASFINRKNGTLDVGTSLQRAVPGVSNASGATFVNGGTVNNNIQSPNIGISNNGVITNCTSPGIGNWNGPNASPNQQVDGTGSACDMGYFAGSFAPSTWQVGENPAGKELVTWNSQDSVTLKNYKKWATSGADISHTMASDTTVTFSWTYQWTNYNKYPYIGSLCPASYSINGDIHILNASLYPSGFATQSGTTTISLKKGDTFGLNLNGTPTAGGCNTQSASQTIEVLFTVSDLMVE